MAHAQMLTAVKVFMTPITNPAWKLKPSWYMVATADRTINPDLERMYAERAHSHKVEAEGASHAVYISHAKEVAALIEEAANQARVADSHTLEMRVRANREAVLSAASKAALRCSVLWTALTPRV
jgi:hypothetical protein